MSAPTNRTVNIYINSAAAQKQMADLEAKFVRTANAIKKGQAAGKDMTKEILTLAKTKDQISQLEKMISGKLAPTFQMTKNRVSELRRELDRMSKDAPGYADKFDEFTKANEVFKTMQTEIKGVSNVMVQADKTTSAFWKNVKSVSLGTIIGGIATAAMQGIGSYVSGIISGNARLSDSLADIRKTTGMTEEAVKTLNSSLGKIDTRTATKELRDIAIGLGQIGEAATPEAVASIDKIVVALGDEFGGGAKEITTTLGVLRNNLQDIKTKDYGADVLSIGNALNVLGASGLATAPIVVDFANRMAGVAGTFKLTSGQILGLAATMQELGIEVERGSTATVKIFQKIAAEPGKFARVAGMDIKTFSDLINRDMLGAFNAVAIGAGRASGKNTEFGRILKELDTDGSGAGEVLSKLAKNQVLLADKVKLSADALKETNSINDEFNIKNTNMAANLAKLEKVFAKFITSSAINNFLGSAVLNTIRFIEAIGSLLGFVQRNIVVFALWAAAYVVQVGWVKRLVGWMGAQVGITNSATAAQVLSTFATKADIVATSALGVVKALLTLNMKRLRQEWLLMTAAMGMNPYTAALLVISALVFAVGQLYGKTKELTMQQKSLLEMEKRVNDARREALDSAAAEVNRLKFLYNATQNLNLSEQSRIAAAKELQRLAPETFNNFTTEAILAGKAETAYRLLTDAIIAKSKANAAQGELDVLAKQRRTVSEMQDSLKQQLGYVDGFEKSVNKKQNSENTPIPNKRISALQRQLELANSQAEALDNRMNKIAGELAPPVKQDTSGSAPPPELSDAEKKRLESLAEKRRDFLRRLAELSDQAEAANIDRDEAEIQRTKNKFVELNAEADKLFEDHVKYSQLYKDLTYAEQLELDTIYKKHFAKRSQDEYDATLAKVKSHFDIERQAADRAFIKGEITEQQHSDRLVDIDIEEYDARALVAKDYADNVIKAQTDLEKFNEQKSAREVELEKRTRAAINREKLAGFSLNVATAPTGSQQELEARKAELQAKFDIETEAMAKTSNMYKLRQAELNRSLAEMDRQYLFEKIQLGLDTVGQLQNLYSNFNASIISKMQTEAEADRIQNDKKRANYQKQLDKKRLSKTAYDKLIEKLDEEQSKKELAIKIKQFNAEKQMKLVQAGMDLASGIINIWSKYGANPVMAGLLTGALSAISLLNIGIIASSEPPKFKKGRQPRRKGGVPEGPSHDDGGIDLVDNNTGRTVGEMEGDEPILSVDTYNNNPEIVDALLDSSMNRGGERIKLDWLYKQVPKINTGRVIEAMQYNRMVSSGAVSYNRTSTGSPSSTQETQTITVLDPNSIQVMERFINSLDQGINAHVYYNDIEKKNNEINALKKMGSANPSA